MALFAVMLFAMVLQVFCRYVLNYPLLWPEEVTKFSMVWLAFIGASIGLKKGIHVSFNLIVDRFSGRIRRYFGASATICVFAFTGIGMGVGICVLIATTGESSALRISLFWPKLGMIIGFLFMLIHSIYYTLSHFHIVFKTNSEGVVDGEIGCRDGYPE